MSDQSSTASDRCEKKLRTVETVSIDDGDSVVTFPYRVFSDCPWLAEGEKVAVFSDGKTVTIAPASEVSLDAE